MNKIAIVLMIVGYGLLASNKWIYNQSLIVFILTIASFLTSIFLCIVNIIVTMKLKRIERGNKNAKI